jgi:hypothetical protein
VIVTMIGIFNNVSAAECDRGACVCIGGVEAKSWNKEQGFRQLASTGK